MRRIKFFKADFFSTIVVLALAFSCAQDGQDMQDKNAEKQDEQAQAQGRQNQMQGGQSEMEQSLVNDPRGALEKVFVENVNVTTEPNAVTLEIAGNLPSPAYSFERFRIDLKENVIQITPLARQETEGITTQQLVNFEEDCRIDNLESGTYELVVIGETDSLSREITIAEETASKQ